MANGPVKRLQIDVKLDPMTGEKAGKMTPDQLQAKICAAIRKVIREEPTQVNTRVTWYTKTAAGKWR
jgi:hypothetical protein